MLLLPSQPLLVCLWPYAACLHPLLMPLGRNWVRGRISTIRQVAGPAGPELAYDVHLENGQRGVLPARMLRKVANR